MKAGSFTAFAQLPSYKVKAINVGSFDIGEADKVLSIFSEGKGLLKAVAKSAKKPGTKMAGRADILCVNEYLLSTGKTFEIITQAQTLESFPGLRSDFVRLTYGLHYAELTQIFGQGLEEESEKHFSFLVEALQLQSKGLFDPLWLCLEFEMGFLQSLGYLPELVFCVGCREVLNDYNLARFNAELGGIVCTACFAAGRIRRVHEENDYENSERETRAGSLHISPLVWKSLVRSTMMSITNSLKDPTAGVVLDPPTANIKAAWSAAQRLMQNYIEQRASKRLKALQVLGQTNFVV